MAEFSWRTSTTTINGAPLPLEPAPPRHFNGTTPTTMAAFVAMTQGLAIVDGLLPEVAEAVLIDVLRQAGVPPGAEAREWQNGLARAMSLLTHPVQEA